MNCADNSSRICYPDQDNCAECKTALEELENIDTETDKHGIVFVKTSDTAVADEFGFKRFPSLIYFEKGQPSIYEGDLSSEEDVLQWLILQKTEDTIESVNRELLEQMIETSHYLVAFFCKFYSLSFSAFLVLLNYSLVLNNIRD